MLNSSPFEKILMKLRLSDIADHVNFFAAARLGDLIDGVWHEGPPPTLGWWPVETDKPEPIYRFWDGDCWSDFIYLSSPSDVAELQKRYKHKVNGVNIPVRWRQWTKYEEERKRVS